MDRSTLFRYLGIVGFALLFVTVILPKLTGGNDPKSAPTPPDQGDLWSGGESSKFPTGDICTIQGERFKAELASFGAGLRHMKLEGSKYTVDGHQGGEPLDLVTTPDQPARQPLYVDFRGADASDQVNRNLEQWTITSQTGKECVFVRDEEKVTLTKVVRATGRPFELEMELTVKNKSEARLKHQTAIETATWRYAKEIEGGFGRQSPWATEAECSQAGKLIEKRPNEFAPKDFTKPEFKQGFFQVDAPVDFAATSNFYFTQALVPIDGPSAPFCQLRIDNIGETGAFYRSRLAWQPRELGAGEVATYKSVFFGGPKERDVLAGAVGGNHHLSDLIKLGTFAIIAKVLVAFLTKAHAIIGSWGVSIIVMTITVRMLLFPLTWKTIKNGAKMRQMKPELDAINERFANDAQQKQLATMELWKKHQVNPVAGCLPMLAQMPVWFALYTTLQTAAELYHTPFLWFHDLSAPDTIHIGHWDVPFILPLLLGITTFVQQKIMPQQQMDPAQQKMMTYMMPAVFTAMMLFLPAGLGVYMFTNSLLGIIQQLAVERYYASTAVAGGAGDASGITIREIREKKEG